jgi:hypothetical protein
MKRASFGDVTRWGLDCAPMQITGGSNPPQAVSNKKSTSGAPRMTETKYDARLACLLDRTEIFNLVRTDASIAISAKSTRN